MSLKSFHVVFIVASIVLSFFVGAWGLREYRVEGSGSGLALGVMFYVGGVALVAYAIHFLRKMREIGV